MADFKAQRINLRSIQHLCAPPAKVFPLLCPTRQCEWIALWQCRMLYSESGFAENNCVFTTPLPEAGGEEVWIVSRYEPDRTIQFVRTNALRIIRYNITLTANRDGTTTAMWDQIVTAVNEEGNEHLATLTDEKYRAEIVRLEKLLNYFLQTGKALPVEEW